MTHDGEPNSRRVSVASSPNAQCGEIGDARSVNFGYGIQRHPRPAAGRGGRRPAWASVEQGIHNGEMLDGMMFGTARDADAIVASVDQFDFYAGGGIDVAFLGMGEMDAAGNVNVSRLGPDIVGSGRFIDITQSARKWFSAAHSRAGLDVAVDGEGHMSIRTAGAQPKVVRAVRHVTFSARRRGKAARGSSTSPSGLCSGWAGRRGAGGGDAGGRNLRRDVLDRMGFVPAVADVLGTAAVSPS